MFKELIDVIIKNWHASVIEIMNDLEYNIKYMQPTYILVFQSNMTKLKCIDKQPNS